MQPLEAPSDKAPGIFECCGERFAFWLVSRATLSIRSCSSYFLPYIIAFNKKAKERAEAALSPHCEQFNGSNSAPVQPA